MVLGLVWVSFNHEDHRGHEGKQVFLFVDFVANRKSPSVPLWKRGKLIAATVGYGVGLRCAGRRSANPA